jgi:hypothetical protein
MLDYSELSSLPTKIPQLFEVLMAAYAVIPHLALLIGLHKGKHSETRISSVIMYICENKKKRYECYNKTLLSEAYYTCMKMAAI